MSFFRIKTIGKNGRSHRYLYKQTSVRDGGKVRSIIEYWGPIDGHNPERPHKNRNADLKSWSYPKRPDYDDEHMRHLFKTDREAFDPLHFQKYSRQQDEKQQKAAPPGRKRT